MTSAKNGGFSVSTAVRTKSDVIIQDMELQVVINISEYRAAEFYSETEVQVFPKQLKHPTRRSNSLYEASTFPYIHNTNIYLCYVLSTLLPHLVVTSKHK